MDGTLGVGRDKPPRDELAEERIDVFRYYGDMLSEDTVTAMTRQNDDVSCAS